MYCTVPEGCTVPPVRRSSLYPEPVNPPAPLDRFEPYVPCRVARSYSFFFLLFVLDQKIHNGAEMLTII